MTPPLSAQPAQPSREQLASTERKARRFWVSLVVGMLSLQIIGGAITVYLAVGDPAAAIVPDYHRLAVNWDTTRRARQLTEKLGLQIETTASPIEGDPLHRLVRVKILNAEGQIADNLNVVAKVFHHARGTDVHTLRLSPLPSGEYGCVTELVQPGVWQVDLNLEGEHGTAADSREILVL